MINIFYPFITQLTCCINFRIPMANIHRGIYLIVHSQPHSEYCSRSGHTRFEYTTPLNLLDWTKEEMISYFSQELAIPTQAQPSTQLIHPSCHFDNFSILPRSCHRHSAPQNFPPFYKITMHPMHP